MQSISLVRDVAVERTPRVLQAEGIFDLAPSLRSTTTWDVDLDLPESWNVGVIVGPSGAGKSTIARHVFGDALVGSLAWSDTTSILDDFPAGMPIKDITGLLSSVGFSSPPSWLRPYRVLSTGEQFRVTMARALAESRDLLVVDEFTSVVDRTVAQIGSAAIAKTVRRRQQRFVAVTCHYDVLDWLEPDWVYEPHLNRLQRGGLWRRPALTLDVRRVHSSAWAIFRKHHYLDTNLHCAATCFVAFWQDRPVAFASFLHFPHATARNVKREHRTVCLPDFQGVGIGNALSNYVASLCRGLGFRYHSQTSHPAMIRSRAASPLWSMIARPNATTKAMAGGAAASWKGRVDRVTSRFRATFEYVGPALAADEAARVLSS